MDHIANMLTQIKNAQAVGHETVTVPFSKLKFELAQILQKNNFINSVKQDEQKGKRVMVISLKYANGRPAISGAKRVSRPGCRLYSGSKDLKPVKQGYGIAIVSSSQGLLTDKEAKRQKSGGEILCEIW